MRERLSDEEIRAAWEVLQDDDPEPRHPWQWPSYEAGVRWAEDQYLEWSWAKPTADRVARLRQRDKDYADYCARERDQMRPNHGVAFLTGWDAAEASRDPAVLSYLASPGQGAVEASRPQGEIVRAGLPPLGSRWVSPTYGTGVVVKTRHNEDRADELWIRYDSDKLKQPLWCTIPSFYNYQEYDFSQPGVDNDREPWALQSETCACYLDSTGLHLCADSAGDVEILMRRHVWDALLSQCPLIAPPAPPEPDWPAWWATTSVNLTQMRIGSPQIREGARARRFTQEIREDGTVLLTPVVGEGK